MSDLLRYPSFETFLFPEKVSLKSDHFSDGVIQVEPLVFNGDIMRLRAHFPNRQLKNHSQEDVKLAPSTNTTISHDARHMSIRTKRGYEYKFGNAPLSMTMSLKGRKVLSSLAGMVGYNGTHTAFTFAIEKDQPFWGFGEKTGRLNKRGAGLKMWNTDAAFDHGPASGGTAFDPAYASIPFFITRTAGMYVGFYLNNPCETFFDMGRTDPNMLYFGSYLGLCDLYIIPGATMRDVLVKYHDMTGRMEMPSLWSLGYHQCRWSYMNEKQVREIVRGFEKERIPVGCIWLDIDYMDGYRVFTWNKKSFGNRKKLLADLHKKGIKLVTIVDPGVKRDEKYSVYQEGKKKELYCKTFNGKDYIGYVWPGKTVFPDFSLDNARNWWADKISDFVEEGIDGIWIDMNDPSTGTAERHDMLFKHGSVAHQYYHNQYGTMMAKATHMGLLRSDPHARPFILTRSASAGIQKYAAVWTGDNFSKWEHLRMAIPESLNLSLSGVSFNGPDAGGFFENTTPELITRWYQAGFLFPFFRNHSCSPLHQEPFRFKDPYKKSMRRFVNLRYKFLPYLYDLFFSHRAHSEPVLRPVFYEFDKKEFYDMDDQFMVGPYMLQAPILESGKTTREVLLPEGYWFDYLAEKWVKGGQKIKVTSGIDDTKIYIRDGAVIPLLKGDDFFDPKSRDMANLEFNVYLHSAEKSLAYHYEDDGATTAYLKGNYDHYGIKIVRSGKKISIAMTPIHRRYDRSRTGYVFNIRTATGKQKLNIKI